METAGNPFDRATTERFLEKIVINADADCWLWIASVDSGGYGHFGIGNRLLKSHRVAYMMQYGVIPEGLKALHHCDNRRCCNPDHLFLGTQQENIADMVSKGRQRGAPGDRNASRLYPERRPRGESHSAAKLTAVQVDEIRRRYSAGGCSHYQLAREYGVARSLIYAILKGQIWTNGDRWLVGANGNGH